MEKIAGVDLPASAEAELLEAIAWYNEQSEGLGFEFAAEALRTIERSMRYPRAWAAPPSRKQ